MRRDPDANIAPKVEAPSETDGHQPALLSASDEPKPLFCARHPDRPTVLRCGRCNVPICVSCSVPTPVGTRCIACARVRLPPTYELSAALYARAALAGLAVALLGGMITSGLLRGLFAIWLAPVFGLAVGEAIARAARQRRGAGLPAIAGAAVLLGAVFGPALPAIAAGWPVDAAIVRALLVAGSDLWTGVFGLLALFFAVQHLR